MCFGFTEMTFIHKIKDKYGLENELKIYLQFFTDWFYKNKMKTYCVKCRKDTEYIDPEMVRTKNNRLVMQSKCPVCGIKK